jgi:hypothetical protein
MSAHSHAHDDARAATLTHDAAIPLRGDFRCADCGYGVSVVRALPRCPMCGGTNWEPAPRVMARRLRSVADDQAHTVTAAVVSGRHGAP